MVTEMVSGSSYYILSNTTLWQLPLCGLPVSVHGWIPWVKGEEMVGDKKVLHVLVAAPADAEAERMRAEAVVEELNRSWFDPRGIRLHLVGGRADGCCESGAGSQVASSQHPGDDCDVFVGILRSGLGTPVSAAGSGTQEAFARAYARFVDHRDGMRMMVYVADQPALAPSDEPFQLESVRRLRKLFGQVDGLGWTFGSTQGLVQHLRLNLTRQLTHLAGQRVETARSLAEGTPYPSEAMMAGEEAERAFLDLMQRGISGFDVAEAVVRRLTSGLEQLDEAVDQMADDEPAVETSAGEGPMAHELERFARCAEAESPQLQEACAGAIDSYWEALKLLLDCGAIDAVEVLREALAAADSFALSASSVRHLLTAEQSVIARLPGTPPQLGEARRHCASAMDTLDRTMSEGVSLASAVGDLVEELLEAAAV
jgi:hypothetical protein